MSNPGHPISPDEAVDLKGLLIPEAVFQCFNAIIAENYYNGHATFKQDDVIALIAGRMDCSREYVFLKHWLDVEDVYRKAGWTVRYDKPGYNETYNATFEFIKPKS